MPSYEPPAPVYLGPPFRKSAGSNKPVNRIVLHGTVSPTERGGARAIAAFFRSDRAGGSAHYVVDPGEVVQVTWDSVIAWHAPPNTRSIGVEMCDWVGAPPARSTPLPLSRWRDRPHTEMLERTARLVAQLCLANDIPVRILGPAGLRASRRGICEHSDVSQAWQQSTHWDLGYFPRRRFMRMVRHQVAVLTRKPRPRPAGKVTAAHDRVEQFYRHHRPAARRHRREHTTTEPLGGTP